MGITSEQMRVVVHSGGHAVVGAVAGAGKSTTLVHRIVHLLKQGVNPNDILVMMFNKTAQQDFSKRLFRQLKQKSKELKVKTFHSFGMELLNKFVEAGLLPPAKLLTQDWEVGILAREALAYANGMVNEEERVDIDTEVVGELLTLIDSAKSNLYEAEDLRLEVPSKVYRDAFRAFEEIRQERELRTFADLIFDPTTLLVKGSGAAREKALRIAANRFAHIILDEYQDVNESQQQLVKVIAGSSANVMAVGDEDQCIYAFRAAKPEYMTNRFEDDFPGAVRYTLSRTFRFGHCISLAADHLITHNVVRTDKLCISGGKYIPWTTIYLRTHLSKESSGAQVMDAVNDWMTKGRKASEIAILVREYSHSLPVEVSLMTTGTAYKLEGAEPALDRRELKAMRGYLMLAGKSFDLISNEERKEVFEAMLVTPTLYLKGEARDSIVASMVENYSRPEYVLLRAADKAGTAGARTLREAADRWATISGFGPDASTADAVEEIRTLLNLNNYFEKQHAHPDTQREKKMMVDEYHRFAQQLGLSVGDFCTRIRELMQNVKDGGEDVVLVTSVHRSKGREWPHVILTELADGKFPSYSGKNPSPEVLEEERRLFYVGMTRAIEKLTLVAPWDRNLTVSMKEKKGLVLERGQMYASRFLYEANITLSREMGIALHKNEPIRSGYAALPTAIAERYLKDVEAERTAPQIATTDSSGRRIQIAADAPFTPSLF
jgi:DNA helicase-2/ATP-dependent DNA helicase PcrA